MSDVIGIDVSKHNGTIDWVKVRNSGISFAMIRAGYGEGNYDKLATYNLGECNRLNIPCGIYWFSYALSVSEARREAAAALKLAKQYRLELPIAYDFEYDTEAYAKKQGINFTRSSRMEIISAFCEEIEKAGYYTMVYLNQDYLLNKVDVSIVDKYGLWYARYQDSNNRKDKTQIWQFTSSGKVDGIKGYVDKNKLCLDILQIIRKKSLNNLGKYGIINVGDKVVPVKAVDYYGQAFKLWHKEYAVMEVSGDRVVIGVGGVVTAAVKMGNLNKL